MKIQLKLKLRLRLKPKLKLKLKPKLKSETEIPQIDRLKEQRSVAETEVEELRARCEHLVQVIINKTVSKDTLSHPHPNL